MPTALFTLRRATKRKANIRLYGPKCAFSTFFALFGAPGKTPVVLYGLPARELNHAPAFLAVNEGIYCFQMLRTDPAKAASVQLDPIA